MSKPTDSKPLSDLYVHKRIINWGDTDAAQIVYTTRYTDFSLEAIEGWLRAVLGFDWYELNINRHMGTPFVHIDMDLKAMLTPQHTLYITVYVENIGRSSITFRLSGHRDDGVECYAGRFVCVVVTRDGEKPIPIPEDMRKCIEEYRCRTAKNRE